MFDPPPPPIIICFGMLVPNTATPDVPSSSSSTCILFIPTICFAGWIAIPILPPPPPVFHGGGDVANAKLWIPVCSLFLDCSSTCLLSTNNWYDIFMWLFPALRNPTIISPRFSPKFFSSSLTSSLLTTSNCIVSTSSGNGPKYPGNPSLNHRVSRISSIPIRFTGSTSNIRLINSLASPLTWLGILNIPLLIFLNNAGMLSSSNGSFPHNITYNITPHDHTSTSGPAYNLPLITSGAA